MPSPWPANNPLEENRGVPTSSQILIHYTVLFRHMFEPPSIGRAKRKVAIFRGLSTFITITQPDCLMC